MTKPTLLFISMGELATHLLEAVARTDIFDTIVVASRDIEKAGKRVNNAVLGAGIEGHFPRVIAEQLDVHSNDFSTRLNQINPDFIFSAPSLLPWWKLAPGGIDIPFAGYTALHLSLMQKFRNRIAEANVNSVWIGASFPDVINAMLNRTGFGPDYGIGNVQEPIAKIQMGVGRALNCAPNDVDVKLVAQHAFEYYVLNDDEPDHLPPYLLKASLAGKDVTQIAEGVLRQAFPFPYDLHFNRVTASSGLVALQALTEETKRSIHLPGIGALVGGYPVLASKAGVVIDLPAEWTLDRAIAVNEASLRWDGIDEMGQDGTIVFTKETRQALHKLLGKTVETLSTETAEDQAKDLLHVLG
jgi:hypothetical protein